MTGRDDKPTPRQILYGLVGGGFLAVAAILTVGAAVSGISPVWWTAAMTIALAASTAWTILNWRRTMPVLLISIGLFMAWTIGTLVVS